MRGFQMWRSVRSIDAQGSVFNVIFPNKVATAQSQFCKSDSPTKHSRLFLDLEKQNLEAREIEITTSYACLKYVYICKHRIMPIAKCESFTENPNIDAKLRSLII